LHEQTKVSAQTDMLTGLANAPALYTRFDQEMNEAKDQGQQLILLSFNVAGMRAINDNYGYLVGDAVLAEVARSLRRVINEAGLLCRLAGGEFICLLKGHDRDQATELGSRAQAEIAHFKLEARPGKYAHVGLSFGVVECLGDGKTIDEILHQASVATRQNKTTLGHIQVVSETPLAPFPHSQNSRSDLALVR
jgi:diguanylate cyclase (GGDEF)-like protein